VGEAPDGTGLLTEELSQQCERLAREHEVDEAELKAATRRVLLAQREFRHQLDPLFRSETGWQASEPGQLPLVRKRLERFAKALQEIRESLTDLFGYRFCDEESVGVSIPVDDAALLMIPEHLRDDFGDLWEATVNLVGRLRCPKGAAPCLSPPTGNGWLPKKPRDFGAIEAAPCDGTRTLVRVRFRNLRCLGSTSWAVSGPIKCCARCVSRAAGFLFCTKRPARRHLAETS